jgi:hypothetical protein
MQLTTHADRWAPTANCTRSVTAEDPNPPRYIDFLHEDLIYFIEMKTYTILID